MRGVETDGESFNLILGSLGGNGGNSGPGTLGRGRRLRVDRWPKAGMSAAIQRRDRELKAG